MAKQTDIKKAVQQHIEMAEFFSGGVAVKKTSLDKDDSLEVKRPPASSETIKELEEIAKEASKCRKCGLGSTRTNAVPGEGSPSAQIMFAGQAPGADEVVKGGPFVGRAGQLSEKIIPACGLKRQDVFI
jgi:hypothetical protein